MSILLYTLHLNSLRFKKYFPLEGDNVSPQILIHHTTPGGTLGVIWNIRHTKDMTQLMGHHSYKSHIILFLSLKKRETSITSLLIQFILNCCQSSVVKTKQNIVWQIKMVIKFLSLSLAIVKYWINIWNDWLLWIQPLSQCSINICWTNDKFSINHVKLRYIYSS